MNLEYSMGHLLWSHLLHWRGALRAELQKHQFIFATGTKCSISRVSASVVIWEHPSAGDAVQIVLKNSVSEMPNRLLKIACEEAIAKRQFSNYSLSTSNPSTSTNPSLGPWQALSYLSVKIPDHLVWAALVGTVVRCNYSCATVATDIFVCCPAK